MGYSSLHMPDLKQIAKCLFLLWHSLKQGLYFALVCAFVLTSQHLTFFCPIMVVVHKCVSSSYFTPLIYMYCWVSETHIGTMLFLSWLIAIKLCKQKFEMFVKDFYTSLWFVWSAPGSSEACRFFSSLVIGGINFCLFLHLALFYDKTLGGNMLYSVEFLF